MAETEKSKSENNADANDFYLWTTLYLMEVMRQRLQEHKISQFEIGRGVKGFNTLSNNVVIQTKHSDGNMATYALQVKYSSKKMDLAYLTKNPKTCIYKFIEAFLAIRKVEQLILWTNTDFAEDVQDYFEEYVPEATVSDLLGAELCTRYRLKKDRLQEIAQHFRMNSRQALDWENVLLDVADFFDRFLLCVNVAKLETLKTRLINKLVNSDQFDQLCELVRKCTSHQMVDDLRIDRIFTLLKLRENIKLNPYINNKLGFDVHGIESLKTEVDHFLNARAESLSNNDTKNKQFLNVGYNSVKASNDTDCTVSRLLKILKERFVPESDQCLSVRSSDLKKEDDVLVVLKDDELVKFGVKCVIISGVTSNNLQSKRELLQSLQVLKFFVGSNLTDCFVDDFDVCSLDEKSKTFIKGKTVCWSKEQEATVGEIFSDELFRKENHRLVLELFRSEPIKVESTELKRDKYYIHRLGMHFPDPRKELYNRFDLIKAEEILDGQVPASTNDTKTVIISDQPGSGKTIELVNVALELRRNRKYQHCLIVYLDCKAVIQFFKHDNVENMVCQALATDSQVKDLLIEEMFHQRKVILLMDAYDEVSKEFRGRLDSLIRNISERNILRLYIATRPQYEQSIAGICPSSSIICQLEPFSEMDQLNYIKKFIDIESISDSEVHSIVTQNVETLVHNFRSMLGNSLVGISLQTYMIAFIYKAEICSANFEQPKNFEIGSLYKRFIDLKFEETIRRQIDSAKETHEIIKSILKPEIEPRHTIMARRLLDEVAENTDSATLLQPYGIVILQPPAFVHRTYQEYFLALYFLTHSTGGNDQFMNFLEEDMLNNILVQEFLDYHIGKIKPEIDLFIDYPEETSNDFIISDYVPPSSTRLHPDKMKEFHIYLVRNRKDYQHLQLIDFSLGYSLINLFEVLYDALPNSTKSIIHFVFPISKANTKVIILDARVNPKGLYLKADSNPFMKNRTFSGLSEPFVIRMLKILQRKHPEDLIRHFLLNMKREGNFLRWILCYMNEEALEWFMTLLPQLSEGDRADFIKHLDNEKYAYLEAIVQKNASQFLQKLTDCLKTIFDTESVAWYLREKHVFLLITKCIEFDKSEDLEVNRRIDMVKSVYDFYGWAFSGHISHRVEIDFYAGNVNKFKYAAIRNAFRETFYKDKPHLIIV